jgi:hypothetical protein
MSEIVTHRRTRQLKGQLSISSSWISTARYWAMRPTSQEVPSGSAAAILSIACAAEGFCSQLRRVEHSLALSARSRLSTTQTHS